MNKLILSFVLLFGFAFSNANAQDGSYKIKIEIDGISNDFGILAYYYADTKYIHDTVYFDAQGVGFITDNEPIKTGIYLLALPKMNLRYFEFILGNEKEFSLSTDTTDLIGNMVVENSKENDLFYANLKFMIDKGSKSTILKENLKGKEEGSAEYTQIMEELAIIDSEIKLFRTDIMAKHPNAFYTKLLQLMQEIELPENPNPSDSSYAYRYYQEHYFDYIDLTDDRLIRTPVFLTKINRFLDNYTIPVPDSINHTVDKILEAAEPNYDMFQFLLQNIFNKYAKSKIMSHELVYIHLAKNYYGDTTRVDWVDDEQRNKIMEVVRKKGPTTLGKIAPDIFIKDIESNNRRLYDEAEKYDYTILSFWNSSCGHCKKEMPLLLETFKNDLKPLGKIGVFAITTELEFDEAMKFINEHKLITDDWVNCIDLYGSNPFRSVYDVVSTPLILVLDKDKKIIAKRISIEDIKGLIEFDLKKK